MADGMMALRKKPRLVDAQRDFLQWMQPLIQARINILSMHMPALMLGPDGIERIVSDEMKAQEVEFKRITSNLVDAFPWADYGLEKPVYLVSSNP